MRRGDCLSKRYVVTIKDVAAYMFASEDNMKQFVDGLQRDRPDLKLYISEVGDDDYEVRAE